MPDITPNPENTLHIKNMVCNRCIMVVKSQLEQLGLHPLSVELGIAVLPDAVSDETYQRVKASLETFGFELIDDKKSQTVELIKDAIIELVHYDDNGLKTNLSDYLASKLHRDYSALSKLFSETTNTTIEKYLIAQKIERAKELLMESQKPWKMVESPLYYRYADTVHGKSFSGVGNNFVRALATEIENKEEYEFLKGNKELEAIFSQYLK